MQQQNTPLCGILGRPNLGTAILNRSVLVMAELALTGALGAFVKVPVRCVELLLISKLPWLHIVPANAFHTGGVDAHTIALIANVTRWCSHGVVWVAS